MTAPILFYSPASPYARKVLVAAMETGQTLELRVVSTTPTARDAGLAGVNPLAKIPTLVAKGAALYDSRVICQYLDAEAGGALIPQGPARWACLTREALADGLLDAALLLRYEGMMRPEPLRWDDWMTGQWAKIDAALAAMEGDLPGGTDTGTAGLDAIACGCALGYLDFRFASRDWRADHPALAAWETDFSARPAMRETVPKG